MDAKIKSSRGKRASEDQKKYLIDFLEVNVEVAHDRFTSVNGARTRDETWKNLARELNSLGGANKDGIQWRKFWMDQKHYVKERHAQIKDAVNRSGINGTKVLKPLTEMENRILTIMTPQAVDGDISVEELGASSTVILNTVGNLVLEESESAQNFEDIEISQFVPHEAENLSPQPTSSHNNTQPNPNVSQRTSKRRRNNSVSTTISREVINRLIDLEEKKIKLEEQRIKQEDEKIEIFRNILQEIKNLKK